jgi:hypothetical protein
MSGTSSLLPALEQKVLLQPASGSTRLGLLVRMFIAWPMKDDMTASILLTNDKSEISAIKEAITATSSSL